LEENIKCNVILRKKRISLRIP